MQFSKIYLLFLFFFASMQTVCAQSILFEFGQTSSTFVHNSDSGPKKTFFSERGQMLKISFVKDFLNIHEISFGATYFENNSIGQVITTNLDYRTQFFGFFATSHFNVLSLANRRYCASCTDFNFNINTGVQISSLINGTQKIDDVLYNLKGVEDFKGLWLSPVIGANIQLDASNIISLILTYNYMPMINITDTDEDFSINSSQIIFGIRLWL